MPDQIAAELAEPYQYPTPGLELCRCGHSVRQHPSLTSGPGRGQWRPCSVFGCKCGRFEETPRRVAAA